MLPQTRFAKTTLSIDGLDMSGVTAVRVRRGILAFKSYLASRKRGGGKVVMAEMSCRTNTKEPPSRLSHYDEACAF